MTHLQTVFHTQFGGNLNLCIICHESMTDTELHFLEHDDVRHNAHDARIYRRETPTCFCGGLVEHYSTMLSEDYGHSYDQCTTCGYIGKEFSL